MNLPYEPLFTKRTDITKDDFELLSNVISKLLQEALKLGNVCIITLAKSWWIDLCTTEMSNVRKTLSRVKIISAREFLMNHGYAKYYRDESYISAKKEAMLSAVRYFGEIDNIVSIGDSEVEKNAAKNLGKQLNITCKTIELDNFPTAAKVVDTLTLLRKKIDLIVRHNKSLDLGTKGLVSISDRTRSQYEPDLKFVRRSAPIGSRKKVFDSM